MNSFCKSIQNEDGFVLIVALFVLILLTIIGISATNTSTIDLQISQNDKAYKIAFYHADGGIYPAAKLISQSIDQGTLITGSDLGNVITYPSRPSGDTTNFFNQVMGYDAYDGGTMDMQFVLGSNNVNVDVERTGSQALVGGGAEFATGAEGVGGGTMAIFFNIDSFGSGPSNASSNVRATYRKVVGVPGGL